MNEVGERSLILPYAGPDHMPMRRWTRWLLFAAWVYPFLPAGALYTTWLVAWVVLGHRPRSSLDDPKSISMIVDIPYIATALLFVSMPLIALLGVIIGFILTPYWVHSRGRGVPTAVCLVLLLLALYAGAFVFLHSDPLHVLYWYMD